MHIAHSYYLMVFINIIGTDKDGYITASSYSF